MFIRFDRIYERDRRTDRQHDGIGPHLHNNNNKHDNVYGAVIMAEPLRELTRFI